MMDFDGYSEFIGEALQFKFPQSHARAVRSAAVGGDDQAPCERIANTANLLPPSADRVNREGRRVVVDPDVDPARVCGQILNAIRHGATEFLDQEIVHAHFFRIALLAPLAAGVLEIADQFLLLGIPRLSENPKIGAMDDAEIVGDSVAKPLPLFGHGMPEELDDLPAELGEGLVVPVVGDVFVHQGPQPFDGIEMGTVGRKEAQNDFAPGLREPLSDDAGLVIAGVVDKDMDEAIAVCEPSISPNSLMKLSA